MRKKIIIVIIFGLFLSVSIRTVQNKKKFKEEISVLNVEVPVRVFYKGKLVENLKKNDFSLFVNGKERNIVGFNTIRKKISIDKMDTYREEEIPPRYFVLAVNITNFSPDIKKGVNNILDKIIRKKDIMLVFINNKTLLLKNFQNKTEAKEKIYNLVNTESIKAKKRMILYFGQIEGEVNMTKFRLTLKHKMNFNQNLYYISDFLKKYLLVWNEYKKQYLIPDVKTYLMFSKHLQDIPLKKWVISFYQQEMFPKIIMKGELMRIIQSKISEWQASSNPTIVTQSRVVSRLVNKIERELSISNSFPTKEISKIFTKVGATFHSIFINTRIPAFNRDMAYRMISTDLENNLRSLTKMTGGELVKSNNTGIALDKIINKRDVFYVLNYSPKDVETMNTIKIKVHKKNHKPVYDDNIRTEFTKKIINTTITDKDSEIKLDNIKFKNRKLSFKLFGFAKKKTKKGIIGAVDLHVRINNMQDNPIFDKNTKFNTKGEESNISLGFKWLKKGRYEIVIEAKDILTGKMASDFIQIKID